MSNQQYEIHVRNIPLTTSQKAKLAADAKHGCQSSIRLTKKDINTEGEDFALSPSEAKKLDKARANGRGVQLKISKKTLKYNQKLQSEQGGGFLPMLAGLAARALPAIARTVLPALGVGALSGLASTGVNKAMGGSNAKIDNGLFLKKGGEVIKLKQMGKVCF